MATPGGFMKDQAPTRNPSIETAKNRKPYRDSYQNLPESA
jgi:hypothetical protein